MIRRDEAAFASGDSGVAIGTLAARIWHFTPFHVKQTPPLLVGIQVAASARAKLSPTPPRAEPPALRIDRGHVDTSGLERLLLQLADKRAGSDDRLGSALDELRSRMNGPSAGANPVPHIESLAERVADLALRVQGGSDVPASAVPNGTGLDAQFRELNAALEASLNSSSLAALESGRNLAALESDRNLAALESDRNLAALESGSNLAALESDRNLAALESGSGDQDPAQVDAHPDTTGLQELQAIADRLQVIEDAVNSAGSQSARIQAIEAQLSELMQGVSAFGSQIEQATQRAAAEIASQIGQSQQAADAIARLDTIQRELQSLTQRAGGMDERTLRTLETISGTLLRLAQRTMVAEAAATDEPRRQEKPPEPDDSRRAIKKPEPGDSSWATEKPDDSRQATNKPGDSRRATNNSDDSRPATNKPDDSRPATNKPNDSRRAIKKPEPGDSSWATEKPDDSRQATNKPDDSRQATNNSDDSRPATNKPDDSRPATNKEPETVAIETHRPLPRRLASDARKPGKILVFAAVALLILSAGLLYSRLNTHSGIPGAPEQLAPTAPAPAEPLVDHEGSHAQDPGSGNGNATAGGTDGQSLEGEETQQPPQNLETIPATRFDRASFVIADPQVLASGLVLKSQSH